MDNPIICGPIANFLRSLNYLKKKCLCDHAQMQMALVSLLSTSTRTGHYKNLDFQKKSSEWVSNPRIIRSPSEQHFKCKKDNLKNIHISQRQKLFLQVGKNRLSPGPKNSKKINNFSKPFQISQRNPIYLILFQIELNLILFEISFCFIFFFQIQHYKSTNKNNFFAF